MQRHAFMIKIKPDHIDAYLADHSALPPELTADIKAAGISNSSVWMGPDGIVFGYFECEDWEATRAKLAESKANDAWQTRMHEHQEPPPSAVDNMWIHMLEMACLVE
ncbi:MAG: hypothetical protein CMJ18_20950 [Phycisphaeraceae bacterium]|nr:hypothetical protein [Phycisphaeraceae bacterium]